MLAPLLAGCSSGAAGPSQAARSSRQIPQRETPSTIPSVDSSRAPSPGQDKPLSDETPTRIVVSKLRIDLPVVTGDMTLPGNPPDYPLCDVAQYLTTFPFPGRPGTTTWIYGHARERMFLPLLAASEANDGAALIGQAVVVYGSEGHSYTYRIETVHRHATDRSSAASVPPDQRRLVLQTSEGPHGTIPKLQVVAAFVSMASVPLVEATPRAHPIVCAG